MTSFVCILFDWDRQESNRLVPCKPQKGMADLRLELSDVIIEISASLICYLWNLTWRITIQYCVNFTILYIIATWEYVHTKLKNKNKRKQIYDLAWLVFRINKHVQMFVLPGYNAIASLSAYGSAAFTCTWKLRYHWLKGLPRCQVLIMRPRPEMVDRIFTVAEAMFTECKITISCGRLTKQLKKDRPIMLTFAWNIIAL